LIRWGIVAVLALVAVASSCPVVDDDAAPVIDHQMVDLINRFVQPKWKAAMNSRFAGMSVAEARKLMGTRLPVGEAVAEAEVDVATLNLPTDFDSRTNWPGCVGPIMDQGHCGSCWAFGTAESFSDRYCIAHKLSKASVFSPQELVSCDKVGNLGCNGGFPHLAWDYVELAGLPSLDCLPYESGSGDVPKCTSSCVDGSKKVKYKAKVLQTKGLHSEAAIMQAIYDHGPVTGTLKVYRDFMTYSSGIYHRTSDEYLGGHAVKIIGWGVEPSSQMKYWIVANSWGTTWGMDGFFLMLRGKDECGIDKGAVAGIPA